jgi:hypothetical protein
VEVKLKLFLCGGCFGFIFQKGLIEIQHNGLADVKACGIPQAWYGAGLLSLWSKGRVGSIPTSRAKNTLQIQLFVKKLFF